MKIYKMTQPYEFSVRDGSSNEVYRLPIGWKIKIKDQKIYIKHPETHCWAVTSNPVTSDLMKIIEPCTE